MFPREITATPMWIRHGLPLYAPSPPDGDRKLRRQIRSQHQNKTEEEISELVQNERNRLNLKWCFDEYFGGPVANPTLGQIVTANVFGDVHLGYIVDIMEFSITLVTVDTLTVLPMVNSDDIYSAEYSPFFQNYLQDQHVYHPQHIIDWWSRSKYNQPCQDRDFSSPMDTLPAMCSVITSDWPAGDETWFTHEVLPQRENLPAAENAEKHLIFSPDLYPIQPDQSMQTTHSSAEYAVTTAQRYNFSVQGNNQDSAITLSSPLSDSNPCLHTQSHLLPSSTFTPGFVCQPGKLILSSILFVLLITALCHPVQRHVERLPPILAPELLLGSLFIYAFYAQPVACSLVLHNINNRDWFRALAVP